MDNILSEKRYLFEEKSPRTFAKIISQNIRKRRKVLGLSQEELSRKSGVSFGSVKRFETSYEISLISLIKLAFAIDCQNELAGLFSSKHYASIDDVIKEGERSASR